MFEAGRIRFLAAYCSCPIAKLRSPAYSRFVVNLNLVNLELRPVTMEGQKFEIPEDPSQTLQGYVL